MSEIKEDPRLSLGVKNFTKQKISRKCIKLCTNELREDCIYLLDNGSILNFAIEDFVVDKNSIIKELACDFVDISKESFKTLGAILVNIKLGSNWICSEFQIIPGNLSMNLPAPGLLGIQFLVEFNVYHSINKIIHFETNYQIEMFDHVEENQRDNSVFFIQRVDSTNESKHDIIRNLTPPTNKNQLIGFLGLVGLSRKFIKNFALIVHPLNNLLRKKQKYIFDEICMAAFVKLKESLLLPEALAVPDFENCFIIKADASKLGVGFVLLQNDKEGLLKVIEYGAQAFNKSQSKYSLFERNLLAIKIAIDKFEHYIQRTNFVVLTDHKPMSSLFSAKTKLKNNRVTAIKLDLLFQHKFKIVHSPGKFHMSDYLSKMFKENANSIVFEELEESLNRISV